MRPLTLEQIAEFTKGQAVGAGVANNVIIDSRLAKEKSLFIALPGENADGHDYVPEVLAAGGFAIVKRVPIQAPGLYMWMILCKRCKT